MIKTSELIWQDKQHQVLFELIDLVEQGNTDISIFGRLANYAEIHFTLEEEYMHRLNFPGTDQHIRAHNRFRQELKSMKEECLSFDRQFRITLASFLREWLTSHIFGIDKELEQFVLESKAK